MMEPVTTYEEQYFCDEYRAQFEQLRTHYRSRMADAMKARAIDRNPTPNATTVVHLERNADGDVTIATTGDFVDFFNRKYGGSDRIGAVRKSLEMARIKNETHKDTPPARRKAMQRSAEKGFFGSVRTVKRHFAFSHAVFALMLFLSLALLFCSSLVLDNANARVMALESEVQMLRSEAAETAAPAEGTILGVDEASISTLSMDADNTVEFYETEPERGIEMSALLNALLGGR